MGITKACIVPSTSAGEVSTLFIENDNSEEFILANLSLKNFNESLEISFNEGEKICFRVSGPGTIHLTGNILELDENEMDDDDGESEDDMVDELKNLRWTEQQIKQLQNNEDSDDDSDDDDDENENEEDGEDGSEEEDDEEEREDEEIEDKKKVLPLTPKPETVIKQTKTPKGVDNQKSPKKEIEPTVPKTPKTPDGETVTAKKSKDNQISEAMPKKTVKNGIIIEELV